MQLYFTLFHNPGPKVGVLSVTKIGAHSESDCGKSEEQGRTTFPLKESHKNAHTVQCTVE